MKKQELWSLMEALQFIRTTGLPQKNGAETRPFPRRRNCRGYWTIQESLVVGIDVFGDTWILPVTQLDGEHQTGLEIACPLGYANSLPATKVDRITPQIYLTFRRRSPGFTPQPGDLERLFQNRRKT